MKKHFKIASIVALAGAACVAQGQTTVTMNPSKDNTLYESIDSALSNGAGQHMFSGMTVQGLVRRCVLEFDIAGSIPAGATIESASLQLHMSRTISGPTLIQLNRVTREWGEGTSDAGGQEGGGALATDGDATWFDAVFDTGGSSVPWTNSGGDYDTPDHAFAMVNAIGDYTWSSVDMAADVQAWLNDPASNHGWILIGDEEFPGSAKRFDSRENPSSLNRPVLTVVYSEDAGCLPDLTGDGLLDFFDVQAFLQAFAAQDPVADFTGDGLFDFFDVQAFLQAFAAGCP